MGEFIKQNFLPLTLGIAGLAFICIGIFQINNTRKSEEITFEPAASASENDSGKVVVDVEGAVINPGVYNLTPKSRVVDALAAAGGMSDEADRPYVEKNINLAQKVSDGLKIYVPRVGEQILSGYSSKQANSTLNINTATEADLESLPGIGAVTAEKIIAGRPYTSSDDLVKRKIVGQSTFEKIKDLVSAN